VPALDGRKSRGAPLSEKKVLFEQLKDLTTEQRNSASMRIDAESIINALQILNSEDKKVAVAVETQISYIAQAVELVVKAFKSGGRLIYVGAGTSGRLGVLDAAECPPTYGTDPGLVQGIIAGGERAMFRSQEGAEDKEENGAREIEAKGITKQDVVCGIAASLRTPFVVGAVKRAKQLGAHTLYVTTNPRTKFALAEYSDLANAIDVAICPEVGPEVIMGSTRMKSGTAQKLVLNMITTTAMVRLGKVYENMMIDLQMTNQKLRERAKRIVMTITDVSYEEAEKFLEQADWHVKSALVMIKANVGKDEAQRRLEKADGFVRAAIEGTTYRSV
jgi:N-acetylmuramic acid 6-phosphate etherase